MDLEKTPGLTSAEQTAVAAYEETHVLYAGTAMDTVLDTDSTEEEEKAERVGRAVARIEEAYSRLSELAPSGTPGREGGMGYGQLLSLLRRLGLGERAVAKLDDPPVPWGELPEARQLAFCCLDLMHYSFLTAGALDHAAGRSKRKRLYDVPETIRAEMGEEGIAGAHGDRNELQMRLHRLLEQAVDDSLEERRRSLQAFGNDCGYDGLVFISRYEDEPNYVEGFVEGCLGRIAEHEVEDLTHPDDVTAEQLLGMWLDPRVPPEEKREMVLESLKAECEVREDEGNLWRL
jgi:hypothetical protein